MEETTERNGHFGNPSYPPPLTAMEAPPCLLLLSSRTKSSPNFIPQIKAKNLCISSIVYCKFISFPLSAMKRPPSSDSIGAFISMCPTTEEDSPAGNYTREFQSMLMEGMDDDIAGAGDDYGGQNSEKKRRLSVDQVKALEKNFEMENKLEPERKVKLAQELGLQPRQVAVWFQNRRARWKTKQLERDYGVLKSNFDSLKHNYESLKHDNESLLKQIKELKAKLYGEDEDSDAPAKDEAGDKLKSPEIMYGSMKDGSSDSDSSAIVNDDNNSPVQFTPAPANGVNCKAIMGDAKEAYQPEFVKIEEHNFFSGDESCNFFSDDQAPTLQWYCQDQWNLTDDN